ncbi:MAG: PIN domain-containing protein [Chloroflexi bacterium]|nr:PIN domain-containing protein [Chloroflexota bacterium]
MLALDTSALLRYLTNDAPALAERVEALFDDSVPVGVSSLVLLEAAYALRGAPYLRNNPEIADALIELLAHRSVVLVDMSADLASAAIAGVRHLSARHIADALVAAAARQGGATALITNDHRFASELLPVRQLAA